MTTFEFDFAVDRDPLPYTEALFELSEGTYVPEGPDPAIVHAQVEAASRTEAANRVITDLRSLGIQVRTWWPADEEGP